MAAQPKLTDDVIAAICDAKRAEPNTSNKALGERFGLHRNSIQAALLQMNTPANSDIAQMPAGGTIGIAFENLHESPLNPRKFFDPALIEELTDSIAVRGLLQNLVARPIADRPGHYWIVNGGRRYRAIQILFTDGRWGDQLVTCKVIETDDAGHIAFAILENLQREDPSPLEEAEAMLALQESNPEIWTAKAIAEAIGKTPRYVYQRFQLSKKLVPEAKKMLTKGTLTLEAARLLSAQEAQVQNGVLEQLLGYGIVSATDVRTELSSFFIPVSRAIFKIDPKEISIFADNDGDEFFETPSEFWKHQLAAVEAKRAELEPLWSFVAVSLPEARLGKRYITDEAAPKDKQGVLIFVEKNGHVLITEHEVEEIDEPEDENNYDQAVKLRQQKIDESPVAEERPLHTKTSAPEPEQKSPVTKAHIYHAHRRKTAALRAAIAIDTLLATRCACLALLCSSNGSVNINGTDAGLIPEDKVPVSMGIEARIKNLMGKVKIPDHYWEEKFRIAAWKHIAAMEVDNLHCLHAALVARHIGTYAGYGCEMGDSAIALAIATEAGITGLEENHVLTVQREDLNGVRKATLLAIADDAGTPAVNDEMKPGDIADAIAKHGKNYVLPTLRFGTTASIEKALKFK